MEIVGYAPSRARITSILIIKIESCRARDYDAPSVRYYVCLQRTYEHTHTRAHTYKVDTHWGNWKFNFRAMHCRSIAHWPQAALISSHAICEKSKTDGKKHEKTISIMFRYITRTMPFNHDENVCGFLVPNGKRGQNDSISSMNSIDERMKHWKKSIAPKFQSSCSQCIFASGRDTAKQCPIVCNLLPVVAYINLQSQILHKN